MKKLFLSLLALAATMSASAQVAPEAGQTYYIQNVDGGQFFSRGNSWGTQASLDNYGMPFTLVGSDLNSVQLQIKGQTSVLGFDTGLYTDASGGNARSYKIEGNETDGYTIISTTGYACIINGTAIDGSTTGTPAKWKFLTKAQRDALVANAVATAKTAAYTTAGLTETETVKEAEITSKVTNSTLANNSDGWTKAIVRSQNGQPASGSGCTEFWQATGTLSQTISGLTPNGLYRLTARAQYRAISDNPNCYNLYAEGYDNVNATIGLNGNAVAVCGWAKNATSNNVPNGRQAFTDIVNSGADKYFNEVYGNADADGNLTIQISKPGYGGGSDWFTFSTVRLYEISNKVTAEEVAALLATVPTGKMNAAVQTALNTAKTNIEANGSIDNYNALQSAIDNANASITLYSAINATIEAEKAHAAQYGVADAFESAISDIQSAYDNGTLTENKTAELQAALANLLQNNDNSFANASAIAGGQDFYIQNVATGLFLGGANSWGTQASIIEHGIAFTSAKVSDGVYTLDSHTFNNNTDHFFGGEFVDAAATQITFEDLGSNVYALKIGDTYVTANAVTGIVTKDAANSDSKLAQWKVISYEDRLAEMKAGNTDATWMIKEANPSRNLKLTQGNNAWENAGAYGGANENMCMEYFGQTPAKVAQDVVVPNGTYTLTCQGFYDIRNAGEPAYLFANDKQVELIDLKADGNPTGINSMTAASAAFSAGKYVVTLENIVVTDNHLRLGIQTVSAVNNWTIWDNFTLTLVSGGDFNHEASEKNGYLKIGENKYVKIGGSEATQAGVTEDVMEASKVTLKTNIAGISTVQFDDANYMMWNGEKVYTDGAIQQNKTTHKSFWLAEADGLKNIETGKYLGIDGTNATLVDAAVAYEIIDVTYATAEEIAALEAAIAAAEANTVGFMEGEYAPYTNVEAIAALKAAKAIDTTVPVDQNTVVNATTALTAATWTANAEELNAVYDGTFAASTNDGAPAGWVSSNNTLGGALHARTFLLTEGMGNYDNLAAFNQGDTRSAFYIRFDGTNSNTGTWYNYGKTEGYTMPLKGGQSYVLKFQGGAWGDYANKNLSVAVKNAENTTIASGKLKTTKKTSSGQGVDDFELIFTPEADGNYSIGLWNENGSNYAGIVSNITLYSCDTAPMAVGEAGYATFVAPFEVAVPEGVNAYTISKTDEDGATLVLDPVTTIDANTPVVLEGSLAATTVYGKATAIENPTYGLLVGVYQDTQAPVGSYVLQNQEGVVGFYKVVDVKPTVKANRAYLETSSAVKAFYFDSETAIQAIEALTSGKAQIFDLNGRQLSRLQKGINIVNGKKILVK